MHKQLQNGKKKTSYLGDMYSYWANSTVNRSGVVVCVEIIGLGIFICHKNQAPPKDCSWNTDYFLCAVTYLLM